MPEERIQLFIDDREVYAPKGAMLIEVADRHDIHIPRFCYHKKLSVAANCRMCMVEVEKAPKALPACATPAAEGMRVYTRSAVALDAQKGTMEFLLINHPLDCPVCDQGGECELQDTAMGYGEDISRYTERKRVVTDKELGPLVSTDMTRCIHCTRCVRFGSEIAGIRELGATGRGEFMEIGTYVERSLSSELSGNVIDVCPVGALNAKPSRMRARSWEMLQSASLAPHDGFGSNIYLHVLRDQVMRVVPRENDSLNETWISDRDRFSYEGLHTPDRATQPLIRRENQWETSSWPACLDQVAHKIRQYPADQVGVLAAPHSTLEELYMLQKVFRGLGIQNIDHRIRQVDFTDQENMPLFPYLGQTVESVEQNDAVFLIGCDIRMEQPMLAHRIRKATARGCQVLALNPQEFDFLFPSQATWNLAPQHWIHALAEIVKCIPDSNLNYLPDELHEIVDQASVSAYARHIFDLLHQASKASILLGAMLEAHPQASALRALGNYLAKHVSASFGMLAQSGNTAGAWLCGTLPHRLPGGENNPAPGMNVAEMLETPRKVFVLFNLEPEYDFASAPDAIRAMQEADFVVVFTPYVSESLKSYADVILPIATFAETEGTYVNSEGRWQSVGGAIGAPGQARPAWRILRVLGECFALEGYTYESYSQVLDEIKAQLGEVSSFETGLRELKAVRVQANGQGIYRASMTPMYAVDNVVRRADSLQQTQYEQPPSIAMCEQQARDLGILDEDEVQVTQDGRSKVLRLELDARLPMNCVWIQKSAQHIDMLGNTIAPVQIQKVDHG